MNEELRSFLLEIGLWMLVGSVLGLVIRLAKPQWGRRWTKFVLNGQWKLFLFGAIFFGGGAIAMWHSEQPYHAGTSAALCILEIVALIRYGFTPLTPEMERQIDAS
jgi:hypothetical protein